MMQPTTLSCPRLNKRLFSSSSSYNPLLLTGPLSASKLSICNLKITTGLSVVRRGGVDAVAGARGLERAARERREGPGVHGWLGLATRRSRCSDSGEKELGAG